MRDTDDKKGVKPSLSFSIANILKSEQGASKSSRPTQETHCKDEEVDSKRNSEQETLAINSLPWLAYTRYYPPKIPRTRNRKTSSKRKVSGSPRVPFTAEQLAKLENSYKESHYVTSSQATQLSSMLKLPESRVKIWFQNRRAREKKKKTRKTISNYQAEVETYFKKVESCKEHREPGGVGWYPSHVLSPNSTQYKVLPTATSAMCSGSAYWYKRGCNSKLCSPYNNHLDFTIYRGLNLYL